MSHSHSTPVPILLYHSVSDNPPGWIRPYAVAPGAFRRQLELICTMGATAMSVETYATVLAGESSLPEHPVVITFDDGLADFRDQALTALTSAGLTATLFVTTGFLDGSPGSQAPSRPPGPWLDPPGLLELRAHDVEIGAHSHTHPHLDTLTLPAAREEVERPKLILEQLLGSPVASFAYPHGFHSRALRELVRGCGYRSACGVRNALSSADDDPFALSRLTVRADTSLSELAAWLDGRGAPIAPRRELVRTRAWRVYRRSRAAIRRKPGSDWA